MVDGVTIFFSFLELQRHTSKSTQRQRTQINSTLPEIKLNKQITSSARQLIFERQTGKQFENAKQNGLNENQSHFFVLGSTKMKWI